MQYLALRSSAKDPESFPALVEFFPTTTVEQIESLSFDGWVSSLIGVAR